MTKAANDIQLAAFFIGKSMTSLHRLEATGFGFVYFFKLADPFVHEDLAAALQHWHSDYPQHSGLLPSWRWHFNVWDFKSLGRHALHSFRYLRVPIAS